LIKTNQQKAWDLLSKPEAFGSIENAKLAISKYIGDDNSRADIINKLGGYDPAGLSTFLKANTTATNVSFSDDDGAISMPITQSTGKLTWDKVKAAEKENPKLKKDRKWQAFVSANLEL